MIGNVETTTKSYCDSCGTLIDGTALTETTLGDFLCPNCIEEVSNSTPIFGVDWSDESPDEEIGDGDHSGEE